MRPTPCRCTSARWEPTNLPQISVKTVRTARADVGISPYNMLCMDISWLGIPEMSRSEIDVVCPQMRVVHLPET